MLWGSQMILEALRNALYKFKTYLLTCDMWYFSFSALTLLLWRQEGHPACKKLGVGLLVMTIWLELCTSCSSSCYHHLHHPQLQQNRLNHVHLKKWPLKQRERERETEKQKQTDRDAIPVPQRTVWNHWKKTRLSLNLAIKTCFVCLLSLRCHIS